jgi:hypothetical protein
LDAAVNLMVFGNRHRPPRKRQDNVTMRITAQRSQASRSLFKAASKEKVRLRGSREPGGDEILHIPAMYFQTPRTLGRGANSIESDLDNLTMAQFVAAREERHQSYFNVQIERDSFINWIKSILASKRPLSQSIPKKKKGRRPLYDWAPVRRWVFKLMDHHGEFNPGHREWDAQARLEEKISDKMNNDDGPSESLVREHVSKYLKDWRERKAGKSQS